MADTQPAPASSTLVDIPLESGGQQQPAQPAPLEMDSQGLPPRGRGVSRAVAEVLTASGKPVKATLAGCRMAGQSVFFQ